jgi:hypothetical protein
MTATKARVWLLATLLLAAATLLGTTSTAQAAGRDGVCNTGEFCYYFNSDNAGSVSDFTGSVDDYGAGQPGCYEFRGPGTGKGRCVKNNAASVWNRSSQPVTVFFNSGYRGTSQTIAAGDKANLNTTLKNNNASHRFGSGAGGGCRTDGTNTRKPTSILVYRVQLNRVERVGFETYVKNVLPNEWISSWPRASLSAGAMAVKSYGWYWALHSTRTTPSGDCYDVRDDTGDQVYRPGTATASTNAAVDRTWSTRMTRGGDILRAHYCATSTACPAWVSGDWMSQVGSRDMAARGRSWQSILNAYYRNIRLTG